MYFIVYMEYVTIHDESALKNNAEWEGIMEIEEN